jgi:hypothetical protein
MARKTGQALCTIEAPLQAIVLSRPQVLSKPAGFEKELCQIFINENTITYGSRNLFSNLYSQDLAASMAFENRKEMR